MESPFADSSGSDAAINHHPPVLDGWAEHRRMVRRQGAWRAVIAPAVMGTLAMVAVWGSAVWWRGVAGLALAVTAAPLLPLFGVPATTDAASVAAGVGASALAWWTLGWLAARRATRVPGASWPEWRSEYLRLAVGFAAGGWLALALGAAMVMLRSR